MPAQPHPPNGKTLRTFAGDPARYWVTRCRVTLQGAAIAKWQKWCYIPLDEQPRRGQLYLRQGADRSIWVLTVADNLLIGHLSEEAERATIEAAGVEQWEIYNFGRPKQYDVGSVDVRTLHDEGQLLLPF